MSDVKVPLDKGSDECYVRQGSMIADHNKEIGNEVHIGYGKTHKA
jgi:hypothetical protein